MNSKLLNILQSCLTVKDLENEFSKRWGWTKFKEKREYKKLKEQLVLAIESLKNDNWNIYYIRDLENIIISYYTYLSPYMKDMYIQDIDTDRQNSGFRTMFFFEKEKGHVIILNILGNSLNFTVFDDRNGNNITISGGEESTDRQKKLIDICKQKIIDMFLNYLNDNKVIDQEIESMKNFSSDYK